MMRAVIIGASGLIGAALHEVLRNQEIDVVGTRNNNTDRPDLIRFDMFRDDLLDRLPDISSNDTVYVLSAYSNPSWIFEHKSEAEELNYTRTKALMHSARARGARIVFLSSVEVFDGAKGAYREEDAPNPLNFYGVLKERIEKELVADFENYTIVRTSWNIGWNLNSRCVVKLTYETLLKPNAKMARDNEFSIADVNDTARCLALTIHESGLRKLNICSDGKLSRHWLADRIIKTSRLGKEMSYSEVNFAEIPYSERRGRLNDLVNDLSKERLGMQYRAVEDIVDEKVALLDEHFSDGNRQ